MVDAELGLTIDCEGLGGKFVRGSSASVAGPRGGFSLFSSPVASRAPRRASLLDGRAEGVASEVRKAPVVAEGHAGRAVAKQGLLRGFVGKAPLSVAAIDAVQVLRSAGWESQELLDRAHRGRQAIVSARLGGDCWAPDPGPDLLGLAAHKIVLLVAHHDGKPCPANWGAATDSVRRMFDAARAECRDRDVIVCIPPGRRMIAKSDHVTRLAAVHGWRVIAQSVSPWTLLDAATEVYTIGHDIGLLGLLRGLPVRCFANAQYSGWGLTTDDEAVERRGTGRSLDEVVGAICIAATRYVDPFTNRACSFEDILALLTEWRQLQVANREIGACYGMSFWKRRRMADFLRDDRNVPGFYRRPSVAVEAARRQQRSVATWAARETATLTQAAADRSVPVVRIEDGFIRSVGLGADFMPAASIVVDRSGIYYAPRRPSDLETILNEAAFSPALLDQARRLVELLVSLGITKYNTGHRTTDLVTPRDRRRILVPGQVEDDRSVTSGNAGVAGNLDLLARVRAHNPDAFILYKPHPDVEAGHRRGRLTDGDACRFVDRVVRGVSTAAIHGLIDEVHTLTSLTGFEALLRGRRVVAYGQPFYAGWGLTVDLAPVLRRTRRLTLWELVAGTLILYPRYLDPVTRLPCGPEVLIGRLADPTLWRPGLLVTLRRLQGALASHWRHRAA